MQHLKILFPIIFSCLLCATGFSSCHSEEDNPDIPQYPGNYNFDPYNTLINPPEGIPTKMDIDNHISNKELPVRIIVSLPADNATYNFTLNDSPSHAFTFSWGREPIAYYPFIIARTREMLFNIDDIYDCLFIPSMFRLDMYDNIKVEYTDMLENESKAHIFPTPFGEFRTSDNDTEFDIVMNANTTGHDRAFQCFFDPYKGTGWNVPEIELIIIQDKLYKDEYSPSHWRP